MRTNGSWVSVMRGTVAFLAVLFLQFFTVTAHAATVYDNRDAFLAAVGATTVYDFETDSGFPAANGEPLGVFGDLDIQGELFVTSQSVSGTQSLTGAGTPALTATFSPAQITTLTNPLTAIGFFGLDLTIGEIIRVEVTFESGATADYDLVLPAGAPAFTPSYFGLESEDDPIVEFVVRGTEPSGAARAWFLDDLEFIAEELPPGWEPDANGTPADLNWNQDFGRTDAYSVAISDFGEVRNFETSIFTDPLTSSAIDEIRFIWSAQTDGTGEVTTGDLTQLTMQLLTNGDPVYTDEIIVDGAVQPIAGVTRPASDVLFQFSWDSESLIQVRNVETATLNATLGVQYFVADNTTIPIDGIYVQLFEDGGPTGLVGDTVVTQSTILNDTSSASWFSDELIVVDENTQYVASVFSLTNVEGANSSPSLRFFNASNQLISVVRPSDGDPDDPIGAWVEKSFSFFPPAGATGLRLFLEPTVSGVSAGLGSSIAFDDVNVQVLEGTDPVGPNLAPNPSFTPVVEFVTEVPTGVNVVLSNRVDNPSAVVEGTAERVLQAGTNQYSFCEAPDPREGPDGQYTARTLFVAELSFTGTCGDLSNIQLEIDPSTRGFPNSSGVVTLVVGIITTTTVFEGLIIEEQFPEDLTGVEQPCTAELSDRPFKVSAPLTNSPFNEPPIPEGQLMVRDTAICNRGRSLSYRYSGHVFPVRNDESIRDSRQFAIELILGLQGTIRQGTCIDYSARRSLSRAASRARSDVGRNRYESAVSRLEDIARQVQNNPQWFANCPVDANYIGYLKSRALVASGTVFDRLLNPDPADREIYQVPADITLPPLPSAPVIQ